MLLMASYYFLTFLITHSSGNSQTVCVNLGHNNLFGRLSPSIEYLINLKVLYLYKNNFSGVLKELQEFKVVEFAGQQVFR